MTGRGRSDAGNNPLLYEGKGIFEIIKHLQEKRIQGSELGSRFRKMVVIWFMENQFEASTAQVAELIGTTTQHVATMKKTVVREAAWQIKDLNVTKLATKTVMFGTQVQKRMLRAGQLAEAWKVQMDMVKVLQSFGFITKAPERVEAKLAILSKIEHEIKQKGVQGIATIFGNIGKAIEVEGGDGTGGGNGGAKLPAHDAGESKAASD